jgi:O-antigen ligase
MSAFTFSRSLAVTALVSALWLVMMSVTLIESDAYRYAALCLIIAFAFFVPGPKNLLLRDWLAILCIVAGIAALSRFLLLLIVTGEKGASEWLYAFPLLFPILGVAFAGSWKMVRGILAIFFSLALVLLLISTRFTDALTGERIFPLFHHNPIHGAVGCGFLVIGAFYWMSHQYEVGSSKALRSFATVVGTAVIALALFNIWGSKSKGVWLALIPVVLMLVPTTLMFLRKKEVIVTMVAGVLLLGVSVYGVRENIAEVAGPTVESVATVVAELDSGRSFSSIFKEAIESPSTPVTFDERLQLWSNASEVIAVAPFFGSGNHWLTIWHTTRYASIPYTLMHNGYLEILIRHGFLGLAIYGLIFVASLYRVFRASRLGVISKCAFSCYLVCAVYFAFTILSNSNNRLAMGESYALLFSAVCFACTIRMTSTPQTSGEALQDDARGAAADRVDLRKQTLA